MGSPEALLDPPVLEVDRSRREGDPEGAVGRATAVAEGVAAAVRRRQREREPRVLLYAAPGDAPAAAPDARRARDRILDIAESMVRVVELDEP